MVGVAAHGNRNDRFPIYERRNYVQVRSFFDRIRAYGGQHDLFLSLDLRIWPKRDNAGNLAQLKVARDGGRSLPRVENSTLAPMLAALQPTSFQAFDDPPVCSSLSPNGCLCQHASYPGWWDQMAKNYACFNQVLAHERVQGTPYDFLVKLRSVRGRHPSKRTPRDAFLAGLPCAVFVRCVPSSRLLADAVYWSVSHRTFSPTVPCATRAARPSCSCCP